MEMNAPAEQQGGDAWWHGRGGQRTGQGAAWNAAPATVSAEQEIQEIIGIAWRE